MEWLNYHFSGLWPRVGGIARACEKLQLAQPTSSGQLRLLEDQLGEKLFSEAGPGLVMTDVGQVVYQYAGEICGLGRELHGCFEGAATRAAVAAVGGYRNWFRSSLPTASLGLQRRWRNPSILPVMKIHQTGSWPR